MNIDALYCKITWRIIPLLFLCYVAAFIDRINIGYAHLQMKETLGLSDAVYGLGAGIFFITYVIFEIPSNLLMSRVGIRKTLFRIMSLWGLASMATAFVRTPGQFYVARLLLGMFEAGFFPAIMLYLSYWFPAARLARITALFMTAVMVAGLLAGPLSGWLLQNMEGAAGMHGWQWLFILEGLPSLLLAALAACSLSDRPATATWLSVGEREHIESEVRQAEETAKETKKLPLAETVRDWRIYGWGLSLSCVICAGYGVTFWLPQMIRAAGNLDYRQTGLYSAIPYVVGLIAMLWAAGHAEKTRNFDGIMPRQPSCARPVFA
jgi:MFS family permease